MKTSAALLSIADVFPLLGEHFAASDFCKLDLSIHNPDFHTMDVTIYENLEHYIQKKLMQHDAKVGYGGYGEHRIFYQQSPLFNNGFSAPRSIHLGIDLWTKAHTPVFAPLGATVHSFQYNDQKLDYGTTIILQHQIEDLIFHTLYGHLTLLSLNNLQVGKKINKGDVFTAIGERHENGGWVPHLHFQIILDMQGKHGDFPGVANAAEVPTFFENCPNPLIFMPFLT